MAFKIGDLVTGTVDNKYGYTTRGAICRVVGYGSDYSDKVYCLTREAVTSRCRCTLLWSIIQTQVAQTKAGAMKQEVLLNTTKKQGLEVVV